MSHDTIADWHQVVKTKDFRALRDLLAENVVFHSPVVHTPQVGKDITSKYLMAALGVLFNESFRYVRETASTQDAVLEFVVELDGISVNGVDMITWDNDGKIVDFKVMVRPLKAMQIVHQKMAEMLQAAR